MLDGLFFRMFWVCVSICYNICKQWKAFGFICSFVLFHFCQQKLMTIQKIFSSSINAMDYFHSSKSPKQTTRIHLLMHSSALNQFSCCYGCFSNLFTPKLHKFFCILNKHSLTCWKSCLKPAIWYKAFSSFNLQLDVICLHSWL